MLQAAALIAAVREAPEEPNVAAEAPAAGGEGGGGGEEKAPLPARAVRGPAMPDAAMLEEVSRVFWYRWCFGWKKKGERRLLVGGLGRGRREGEH